MPYDADPRPLRLDALPPLRPQRPAAARDLARAVAELRWRPPARDRRAPSCAAPSTSGITHFDLANNYGPPYGSAESNFGRILAEDFKPYRDELIVSTKAGYDMWPGPYGDWGSRKYLLASLDQSLQRMGLDYVDIFYSHRADPDTPLEETMGALHTAVQQGKALYAGISSYSAQRTEEAGRILRDLGTPVTIHQPSYSMLNRWIEPEPARRARPGGDRLHRLLAARPGDADRQVPRRRARELARGAGGLVRQRHAERGEPRAGARAERDRAAARPEPRLRRWRSRGRCATRASRRR